VILVINGIFCELIFALSYILKEFVHGQWFSGGFKVGCHEDSNLD
jgi:hypothetical protein